MENKNCIFAAGSVSCSLVSIILAILGTGPSFWAGSVCLALIAGGCMYGLMVQYMHEKEEQAQMNASVKDVLNLQVKNTQDVAKKIETMPKDLQEAIVAIRGELRSNTEEQCKNLQVVLDQIQTIPTILKQSIDDMNEKTKKQFNDMQQQDIDKYNQLVRNVQKNVDKILSEWRQQTTAQLNKIQQATIELEKVPGIMGKTVNDIDNNLRLHTKKQHQNLQVLIEQLQTMPEVMKDGMNIMNGDMKSQMDRQLSEIQHVCEQLNTISEAMKKEVSNGVNAVNETFDGTNKILQTIPEEVKNSYTIIQDKLSKQMEDYLLTLQQTNEDFEDMMKKIERGIGDNLGDIKDAFDETRDGMSEAVDVLKEKEKDISNDVNTLASQYKEFEKFTNALVKQLTDLSEKDQRYWKDFIK
ncbi:hypothetical protein [uncultured Megasphaera sp.]|uniref:hypothetical protein n=1 Tax=uncultured Megasphaera sp. TaxID=165188 RepID=UPI0025EFCF7E|nr:hypothetical protein [uncultured Megasphaera sp.]